MNFRDIPLCGAVAWAATAITSWLGGWDAALRALVVFMIIDYITGLLAAVRNRRVSSDVMFWGGIRKAAILVVVGIGVLMDGLVGNHEPVFRTMAVYFYVAREGLSVVENLGLLGIPLPQFLTKTLAQLQPNEEQEPNAERRFNFAGKEGDRS